MVCLTLGLVSRTLDVHEPAELAALRSLHLNRVGLTRVANLEAFVGLLELYLNDNFLEDLEGLEPVRGTLRVLSVARNKLRGLPDFGNFELRVLDASGNCFEVVDPHALPLKSLTILDLRPCETWIEGPALRELNGVRRGEWPKREGCDGPDLDDVAREQRAAIARRCREAASRIVGSRAPRRQWDDVRHKHHEELRAQRQAFADRVRGRRRLDRGVLHRTENVLDIASDPPTPTADLDPPV